jgi:hypothetical protein
VTEHDGKADSGKLPFHLLPWKPIEHIVAVLDFGAKKYSEGGWKQVPRKRDRYFSAAIRHLVKYWGGEVLDSESGLPHLAHAACNIIFLMESEE